MPIEPISAVTTEVAKEAVKQTFKEGAKEVASEVGEAGLKVEVVETTELLNAETAALNETKAEVSKEYAEFETKIQEIVDLVKDFEFNYESFISDPEYMIQKIGDAITFLKDISTKITEVADSDYVNELIDTLHKIDKTLKMIQSSGSTELEQEEDGLEGFGDGE